VTMPVATFRTGEWELGELKDCQQVKWRDNPILQCDIEDFTTELVSLGTLPEPQRTLRTNQLHARWDNAKIFAVIFHAEKDHPWKWVCQKIPDGITCR